MRAHREKDKIVLSLNPAEGQALEQLLKTIIANYRIRPGDLDEKARLAWYSTRGCESAGLTAEETKDWLEQLHGYKSANVQRLEEWCQQISTQSPEGCKLRIEIEDAPVFLMSVNDHRLAAAARQEIGQTEMDLRSVEGLVHLKPEQQVALFEIELLGWLMEVVLRLLDDPDAAPPA